MFLPAHRPERLLIPLCLFLGFIVCGICLFYGVSLNDEALYSVWPYRFALGDRPFIDETYLGQGASLFITPLISFFVTLTGETTGIVFFHRVTYFFFSLALAYLLVQILKTQIRFSLAALLASSLVFFLPWRISAFSYNTLPMLLLSFGLFFHLSPAPKNKWSSLAAGAIFSACALANPAYVFPVLTALVLSLFWYRKKTVRLIPYFLIGALLLVGVLSPYLKNLLGAREFWEILNNGSKGGAGFFKTFYSFLRSQPGKFWYFMIFGFGFFLSKKSEVAAAPLILFGPLVYSFWFRGVDPHWFFNSYGLFAPFYYLSIPEKTFSDKALMLVAWPTSLIAAVSIAWSSTNGFYNSGLGFFPGVLVTLFFLIRLSESWCARSERDWPKLLVCIILFLFQSMLIGARWQPYSDEPLPHLKYKVGSGPYKGLYTTKEKQDLVLEAQKALEAFSGTPERVVFYDHFPAGYLMTQLRPLTTTAWDLNGAKELFAAMEHFGARSFVSVRVFYPMNKAWFRVNLNERSVLDQYLETLGCSQKRGPHFSVQTCTAPPSRLFLPAPESEPTNI